MIKINLVGEGRKPVAGRPAAGVPVAEAESRSANLALIGVVAIGLLAIGAQFLLLKAEIGRKRGEVAEAQAEVERLAPIIKEVEEFKQKKRELERKVAVINNLKANQRGPVQIMDEISRALPELLWLTRMEVRGNSIRISGEAYNVNALSNFIDNLDKVPEFQEPVLRDSQKRSDRYTFNIELIFNISPTAEGDETPAAASGG